MSLKLIKFDARPAPRLVLIAAVFLCAVGAWFFVKWHFANAIASQMDTGRPESRIVADLLTGFAPADPESHFAAARVLEKTLDADDLNRALTEYEIAAALSPGNYIYWLRLGRARERNGDRAGAVEDASGNKWWVATRKKELSPDELKKAMASKKM